MNGVRWNRIAALFDAALELPPAEREGWVRSAAGADDPTLSAEVLALLAAEGEPSSAEQWHAMIAEAAFDAARAAEAEPAESGEGPRRFGPYRVVRPLGQGGMGAVFEAVRDDDTFEKRVALKVIKRDFDTDFARRRFQSERQILAALDHPNICRLLDGGTSADGQPYLVMEYIEGKPLREIADALDVEGRIRLFLPILAAVGYAHQRLVVHRDLKPSNVMVGVDGVPRLLDFGIAKILDQTGEPAPMATTGQWMTPDYASPEQITGATMTTASDLYSLGVMLYEMLAGTRPHQARASSPFALIEAICHKDPSGPSSTATGRLRRQLSGDLDIICLKALQRDPSRRYVSAESFADDLRRYLEGRPIAARKDTLLYRARKFAGRNRAAVAAGVLLLVAVAGGVWSTRRQAWMAEQGFREGRQLASRLLGEIYADLEAVPGATAVREKVARSGLEYLNRISSFGPVDSALALELAQGFESVGNAYYFDASGNLGRGKEARDAWLRALEFAGRAKAADNPRARLTISGRCHFRLAAMALDAGEMEEAADHARQGIEFSKQRMALYPKEYLSYGMVYSGYSLLGDALLLGNRIDAAVAEYQAAIRTTDEQEKVLPDARVPRARFNTLTRLARAALLARDPVKEKQCHDQAALLIDGLKADVVNYSVLSSYYLDNGRREARAGNRALAERQFNEVIDMNNRLLMVAPEDEQARNRMALAHAAAAEFVPGPQAAAHAKTAVEEMQGAAARNPELTDYQFELAWALMVWGERTGNEVRRKEGLRRASELAGRRLDWVQRVESRTRASGSR